ncbi:MAG: hypothetical protein V2A34_04305 [Lentisphaerota bacterium]
MKRYAWGLAGWLCLVGVLRCANAGPLANGELSVGAGGDVAPEGWSYWNENNADPEYGIIRSAPNAWAFWDNAGIYQDIYSSYVTPDEPSFYIGDTIRIGGYLYTPSTDRMTGYSWGYIHAELWNTLNPTNPLKITTIECGRISQYSSTNTWMPNSATFVVPTNTTIIRVIVRFDPTYGPAQGMFYADDIFFSNLNTDASFNMLKNPGLGGIADSPTHWQQWFEGSHDTWFDVFRSPENSWCFWWDGGLYQDTLVNLAPGFNLEYGAYLQHPSWDALRNGTKRGVVNLELYNGASLLGSYEAHTNINATRPTDTWLPVSGSVLPPTNTTAARVLVRCANYSSGDGRFMVDDVALRYRSIPVTTHSSPTYASAFASGCIVQSNPAVAYWVFGATSMSGSLVYARCANAEGDGSWTSRVVHSTHSYPWGAPFPSMAVVQGNPAIAVRNYPNDGDLYYFRCSTANGMGVWTSVVVDVTNNNTGVDATLLMVNGRPAISAMMDKYGDTAREIRYYRANTANGVGSWTRRTLALGPTGIFTRTCIGNMALMNNRPAVAYAVGKQGIAVGMLLSTNINGDGTWRTNFVESFTNCQVGKPHFAIVSNRPAMVYVASNNLRFAINSSSTGTGTWSKVTIATNVASEAWVNWDWYYPVKLSVYNGKPVVAFLASGDPYKAIAYSICSTGDGLGTWTTYRLAEGGFIGALLQHNGRPLLIHEGSPGVRVTR